MRTLVASLILVAFAPGPMSFSATAQRRGIEVPATGLPF